MDKGYDRVFQQNPMPEQEARKLFAHMRLVSFAKGDYVMRQGEYNSDLYVIDRGIWSGVEKRIDNADITLWFAFSGEAVFNVWSYVMDKLSPINIISETESTAWVIGKSELEQLTRDDADIRDCFQKIILGHLAYYENRLLHMSKPSNSSERYLWLTEWHPELLREVPLSRIASFLGVTIQSLSRIRKNIFRK